MPRPRERAGASRDIPVGLRPTLTIYTCWLTRTLHGGAALHVAAELIVRRMRPGGLIPPKPLHWSVGHVATVAQRTVSDAIAAPVSISIGGPRPSWPVG